jgi:hypothetical protein
MPDENEAPRMTQRERQDALEEQITQLKREVGKLKRTLAERAEEASEEVGGWYDAATERASRATAALKTQAHTVSETVRENPGTVSSAMLVGGLIGFVIGLLMAQTHSRHGYWY